MNAIKFIFIGLFLFAFSLKSTGQSLSVDFSYDKSTQMFEIGLMNNTEKQIAITNFRYEEGNVSYLVYSEKSPDGTVKNKRVLLWDDMRHMNLDLRILFPHETMHLSRPIYDSSRRSQVVKARLKLDFMVWDSTIGKYTFQKYEKEILINE